jgi:hypothetical protein
MSAYNYETDYAKVYPELSKEGQERTKILVDKFRKQIEEVANTTLVEFADTMASEIVDDDSWISFRRTVIDALCGYGDREKKMAGTYDGQWWTKIRAKILEENREAIVTDILLDKEHEIESLKQTIEIIQRNRF